jgi:hypothetical protein
VDFVAVDKNGDRELIQVCWDLSDPKTAEREQRARDQAQQQQQQQQQLGITGRIITFRDYLREFLR